MWSPWASLTITLLRALATRPLPSHAVINAADGMERGACHLGDVLSGDRKIDEDPSSVFRPACLHEAQQGVCDTAFDLLG